MKVKLLKDYCGHKAGDIIEPAELTAYELIVNGWAEKVTEE